MTTSGADERFDPGFRVWGSLAARPELQQPFTGPVGVLTLHISGDIGGLGICRLHAFNADGTAWVTSDAAAFAAAAMSMWNQVKANLPQSVTITCDGVLENIDMNTAAPIMSTTISPLPAPVSGSSPTTYGAGIGARGYWHTITVRGRRKVRGATYLVPFTSNSFTSQGALTTSAATAAAAGMGDYAVAMQNGGFFPGVYCRPRSASGNDGALAPITAWSVGTTPGGLRSRRS